MRELFSGVLEAIYWLADRLWGDKVFQWLKPMIPAWLMDATLRDLMIWVAPILIIVFGVFLHLRARPKAAFSPTVATTQTSGAHGVNISVHGNSTFTNIGGHSNVERIKRTEWEQEWHELRQERRKFWRLLEAGYSNWRWKADSDQRSLMDLINQAAFPALPLQDNCEFPDWVWTAHEKFDEHSKHLYRFVSEIYIPCKPEKAVKSQILGTTHLLDEFDDIRNVLAKFWDHWGRQEPLEQVIREQKADGLIKSSTAEIKMLTFLEIGRPLWAPTGAHGKSGLFKLGRRNVETG